MQLHWFSSLAAVAVLSSAALAQTLLRTVNGPAASAQFGKACISVPDQNSDGFADLLVGAPGFNSGRGAVYCISGRYLASGSGAQTLWSLTPGVAPDDNFGFALADVGDLTGDGVHDFLIGQPGYFHPGSGDNGAVRLVHGSTHTIISLIHGSASDRLGAVIAVCGDLNANGSADVALGTPESNGKGLVRVVEGSKLTQTAGVTTTGFVLTTFNGSNFFDRTGAAVAGGSDLTGDGVADP
jgi:hypothetical protein